MQQPGSARARGAKSPGVRLYSFPDLARQRAVASWMTVRRLHPPDALGFYGTSPPVLMSRSGLGAGLMACLVRGVKAGEHAASPAMIDVDRANDAREARRPARTHSSGSTEPRQIAGGSAAPPFTGSGRCSSRTSSTLGSCTPAGYQGRGTHKTSLARSPIGRDPAYPAPRCTE